MPSRDKALEVLVVGVVVGVLGRLDGLALDCFDGGGSRGRRGVDEPSLGDSVSDEVDGMRDGLALLGGEGRLRHLYCATGAVDDVVARWRAELDGRAEVLVRDEVIARGWFGDVHSSVRPRIGDVVVAARGDTAVLSSRDFPYEAQLVGMHGSLTPEEMLIPLLVD